MRIHKKLRLGHRRRCIPSPPESRRHPALWLGPGEWDAGLDHRAPAGFRAQFEVAA